MAYADTFIVEADAPAHDGHQFDEVRLANMAGDLGEQVWYDFTPEKITKVGGISGKKPIRQARKRLIVSVEGDQLSQVAVQRVRHALRWTGQPMECPF